MKMVNQTGAGTDDAVTALPKQKLEINPEHSIMKRLSIIRTTHPDVAKEVCICMLYVYVVYVFYVYVCMGGPAILLGQHSRAVAGAHIFFFKAIHVCFCVSLEKCWL